MKERPILFSGPMVQAILDGRKTQTRRIVKPSKAFGTSLAWCDIATSNNKLLRHQVRGYQQHCPHGQPGDRLWVRETWREGYAGSFFYRADEPWHTDADWRPSIHMPRGASRITLEIVSVRVERLQAISEEDARAEGCCASEAVTLSDGAPCYSIEFRKLWTSIHGIDNPKSWDANPWVWVIEFRRVA